MSSNTLHVTQQGRINEHCRRSLQNLGCDFPYDIHTTIRFLNFSTLSYKAFFSRSRIVSKSYHIKSRSVFSIDAIYTTLRCFLIRNIVKNYIVGNNLHIYTERKRDGSKTGQPHNHLIY